MTKAVCLDHFELAISMIKAHVDDNAMSREDTTQALIDTGWLSIPPPPFIDLGTCDNSGYLDTTISVLAGNEATHWYGVHTPDAGKFMLTLWNYYDRYMKVEVFDTSMNPVTYNVSLSTTTTHNGTWISTGSPLYYLRIIPYSDAAQTIPANMSFGFYLDFEN